MTEPGKGRASRWSAHYVGVIVIVLTAVVPLLDALMVHNIARQADTARFAATAGTITHSEIFQYRNDDGDVFTGADIRYSYAVGGRTFEGDKLRYSTANFHTSERGWAERAVRKNPVGASVPVYYDPRDPAQSLLQPGLGGTELYLLMFMTGFNAAMVGGWLVSGTALWRRLRGLPPRLPPVFRDGSATRMHFAQHAGSLGALTGIGAASFAGVMVQSVDASLAEMQFAGSLVAGAGAVLGVWLWFERRRGAFDLVIRETTVTMPERILSWRRHKLDRKAIVAVSVKPGWRGLFANQIRVLCADGRHHTLARWYDEDAANALANHVNENLGTKVQHA